MKAKEKYKNYDPAEGLKQFSDISETPMIQMEHLRDIHQMNPIHFWEHIRLVEIC